MTDTPTHRQTLILLGIFVEREELAAQESPGYGNGRALMKAEKAREGFVAPAGCFWMNLPPTPSNHVAATRAFSRLEKLGLICRRGRDVGLTSAGEQFVNDFDAKDFVVEK